MRLLKLKFGHFNPLDKQLQCFNISKSKLDHFQLLGNNLEGLKMNGLLDKKQYKSVSYRLSKMVSKEAFSSLENGFEA